MNSRAGRYGGGVVGEARCKVGAAIGGQPKKNDKIRGSGEEGEEFVDAGVKEYHEGTGELVKRCRLGGGEVVLREEESALVYDVGW